MAATLRSRRALDLALVGGFVLLGAALWLPGIRGYYWLDEGLSIGIARRPIGELPSLLTGDGAPPLWYALLAIWGRAFGWSEVATHSLSFVVALAAVPVAWWAGRLVGGRRVAVVAAAIAALSPFLSYFSAETRMYSLVVVLSMAVAATFVRAFVDDDSRAAPLFACSLGALLYTHYWGLYTAIAAALALGLVLRSSAAPRPILRRAAMCFGAVAVAYLPWLPVLVQQLRNTGAPWSFTPDAREVIRQVAALFRDERVLVALVLGAGTGLVPMVQARRGRDAVIATTLGAFAAVPIILGWLAAHIEPSWATRYLAVVVGPLVLLVALGLARAGGVGIAALAIVALLLTQPFTRLGGEYERPRTAKSPIGELAAVYRPSLRAGDVVVAPQPEAVPLLHVYFGDDVRYVTPEGRVPEPDVVDWRDAERRLRAASAMDAVAGAVDGMEIGDRLLVVTPPSRARETDTSYIRLVRAQARQVYAALTGDRRLRLVDHTRPEGPTEHPALGFLYERVAV